jgi:hypothetical protein
MPTSAKFRGYKFVVDPVDSPGPFSGEEAIKGRDGKVKRDEKGQPIRTQGSLVWVNIYGSKGHMTGSTKAGGYVKRAEEHELLIELGGQSLAFQQQKDPATGALLWTHIISQPAKRGRPRKKAANDS